MRQRHLQRLKYLATINDDALPESTDPERAIRYLDISSVGRGHIVAEPEPLTFEAAPSRARRLVRSGDTIVSTVRTYLRAVLPIRDLEADLVVSTGFAVLRPRAEVVPRFLSWVIQSDTFIEEVVARSVGVSYPGINASEIGDIRIPAPALSHQTAIADYLDTETARIDALIAKKQRMIAAISSRTESLIAELFEPLIREFGEVPLKAIANLEVSNVDKKSYEGQQVVRLCNYTDVYYNRSISRDLDFMTATADRGQIERLTLKKNDVLITKDSETADDIAVPAWVAEDLPHVVLGYHLALLRPHNYEGRLLYWAMVSRRCRDAFSLAASGVTRVGLRRDQMSRVLVPAVPRERQTALVSQIDQSVAAQDQAAVVLRAQIELLRERRQTLITAAVTGELEIPGVAA